MPTIDIETWFSTKLLDEDDFASNSDTKVPSQQSVEAYITTAITNALTAYEESKDLVWK